VVVTAAGSRRARERRKYGNLVIGTSVVGWPASPCTDRYRFTFIDASAAVNMPMWSYLYSTCQHDPAMPGCVRPLTDGHSLRNDVAFKIKPISMRP
jgi:hypothetical protein